MPSRCAISNCRNSKAKFRVHGLPLTDPEGLEIWLERCQLDHLKDVPMHPLNSTFRICDAHFEDVCRFHPDVKFLKPDSRPTKNLPGIPDFPPGNSFFLRKNALSLHEDEQLEFLKDEQLGLLEDRPSESFEYEYEKLESLKDEPFASPLTAMKSFEMEGVEFPPIPPTYKGHARRQLFSEERGNSAPHVPSQSRLPQAQNAETDVSTREGISYNPTTPTRYKDWKGKRTAGVMRIKAPSELTPKAAKLYRMVTSLRKEGNRLRSRNSDANRRLQEAQKLLNSEKFDSTYLNKMSLNFFRSQIKLQNRHPKGRRFSFSDNLFALTLYKQSPKGYRLLHKIFALPSITTLKKVARKVKLNTGLNPQLIVALKEEGKKLKEVDKYCSLVFDEISLQPGLFFNVTQDIIDGFEDVGNGQRREKFADHALVFMLRGVITKWKQPLSFYLVARECGFYVVSTICDQHSTNSSVVKYLLSRYINA